MSTEGIRRRAPPVGAILALAVAAVFYLGMMLTLSHVQSADTDAVGRAMAEAFAIFFGIGLWMALAALLLIGGVKGEMPVWSAVVAALLLPISGFAAIVAVGLLDRGDSGRYILVPGLIAPLIAGYAIWGRLPDLHRIMPPLPTSLAVWAAIALLTAAPLPHFIANTAVKTAAIQRERAEAAAAAAKVEAEHRQKVERFHKLTAASPLWDWAEYFGKGSEFDAEAIAGANKLSHLQADAEEALRRGMGFPLIEYQRLNVAATPAYCAAAGDFLIKDAAAHKAADGEVEYTEAAQPYTEPDDVAVIEWLTEHCDIDEAVARIRASVGSYKQTRSRDAYLGVFAWRRGNGFFRRGDSDRALEEYSEAIRLSPDNAQFYNDRAQRYSDRNDYARAIADYDTAIRLNSGYSRALNGRGLAYYFSGRDDLALCDFDEAIQMDPKFMVALNNRGNVRVREGDIDKAIEDYAEAVRLAPESRVPLANRGRARFYQAAYKLAVDDIAASLAMKPSDPYLALWAYLARARAGQDAGTALTGDAAPLARNGWPWPLVRVYLGTEDAGKVLAELRRDTNPDRQSQECEAGFYLGAKAVIDGQPTAARELLQLARANCRPEFIEGDAARYELDAVVLTPPSRR